VLIGNACHLSDAFFIGNGLADFPELFDADVDGLVDTSFEDNGICARSHVFAAFFDYCLRQNNCGCGAVAGNVVGFGGHFLDDLRAHVFKLVFEFDFLGDCHAVVGDEGAAVFAVYDHVSALGAECDFNGVGELIYAGFKSGSRVRSVFDLFCHNFLCSLFQIVMFIRLSPKCRSVL